VALFHTTKEPSGWNAEGSLQKPEYELFYSRYPSFPFDLSILFHTIKTVVLRGNPDPSAAVRG
jgi:lipopolysaccharide/colanic/teichoic acid biosynthesis glycosyltransferase